MKTAAYIILTIVIIGILLYISASSQPVGVPRTNPEQAQNEQMLEKSNPGEPPQNTPENLFK